MKNFPLNGFVFPTLQSPVLSHVLLDCVERLAADVVFDAAGVLRGGLFIDTEAAEEAGQDGVAFVDVLGALKAGVGQFDEAVRVHDDEAVLLEEADGAADRGLGEAHVVLPDVDAVHGGGFLGQNIDRFQIHFTGFLHVVKT